MTVEFIDICSTAAIPSVYRFEHPISVAVGILIIPLFDTIRVFTTRILRGVSPMKPDRRHIHHLLIDSNFSHIQATFVLALVNLFFISLALYLDPVLDLHLILAIEIASAIGLTYWLNAHARTIKANKRKIEEATAATAASVTPHAKVPSQSRQVGQPV